MMSSCMSSSRAYFHRSRAQSLSAICQASPSCETHSSPNLTSLCRQPLTSSHLNEPDNRPWPHSARDSCWHVLRSEGCLQCPRGAYATAGRGPYRKSLDQRSAYPRQFGPKLAGTGAPLTIQIFPPAPCLLLGFPEDMARENL